MSDRVKNIVLTILFPLIIFGFVILHFVMPDGAVSQSERRPLEQFPELSTESISKGEFMTGFEDYLLDQFPFRDTFRTGKATVMFNVLLQKDNNDIYFADGHASELDDKLNENLINEAGNKILLLAKQLFGNKDVNYYYSVVPDKNYFLAEQNGYPVYDYDKLNAILDGKLTDKMTKIDIFGLLTIDDYYKTDTHWKQENLGKVMAAFGEAMGFEATDNYTKNPVGSFYGVYYGRAALPLPPDPLTVLKSQAIEGAKVQMLTAQGRFEDAEMYDYDKFGSEGDPYDIYLSGTQMIITIENENAQTDKELFLFRDSFGSSIAPLFTEYYSKITVIDVRYIASPLVKNFVRDIPTGSDVLFLYSTLVLNNSVILNVFDK